MWYDADIDAVMTRRHAGPFLSAGLGRAKRSARACPCRRQRRQLRSPRIGGSRVLAFTILFYVVVYTVWLKRRTAVQHPSSAGRRCLRR